MSISQRQAIIKLIKKDRDQKYIKNWRPSSLLNVDIKILSKEALAKKLKVGLPCLITVQRTVYVQNRNIGETGRLISDIIEITNIRQNGRFFGNDGRGKIF